MTTIVNPDGTITGLASGYAAEAYLAEWRQRNPDAVDEPVVFDGDPEGHPWVAAKREREEAARTYAERRRAAWLASEWAWQAQMEALLEAQNGRAEKLAALLAFDAALRVAHPKPEA